MADVFTTGLSVLATALSNNAGQSVSLYKSGAGTPTTGVAATKCDPVTEADTQYGILRIVGTQWIIKASLYAFGGTASEPTKNDVIEEADGSRWLVLAPDGEKEARYSDKYGNSWRIHTKRIEAP
jgi:hypothetical protein